MSTITMPQDIIDATVSDLSQTTNGAFQIMETQINTPEQAALPVIFRALEENAGGIIYVEDVNVTYG
ncbi:hypothetical protein BN871_BJ_00040 [Paenibacillus sp. P22]|nr:hypothetical protein BN871_BJ_00040 [Paenibacillus sp. P22]